VRDAILAYHPALPMTLIAEAVAYILSAECGTRGGGRRHERSGC
jgi:hypothetical protein